MMKEEEGEKRGFLCVSLALFIIEQEAYNEQLWTTIHLWLTWYKKL